MRKLKNFYHLLRAYYWSARCGWPGMKMYLIGVTGTDGKTTTATLIYEILKNANFKVGLFSTVEVKYVRQIPITKSKYSNNNQFPKSKTQIDEIKIGKGLHTTNPGPEDLQPILKEMYGAGVTHVVLEVTSHGLDQNRVAGCDFQIGVWTNLTHEHLDYHGNMQNYANAKSKLFKNTKYAVLNQDDSYFAYFNKQIQNLNNQIIIKYQKSKIKTVSQSLNGDYNKYNIAAATEVAKILGVDKRLSDKVIKEFDGVVGRRQEVPNKKGLRVFVDFAHTPNALESVLKQLKKELAPRLPLVARDEHKLILVFGCTGERDREKRPMMGEIAARLADIVIVTSDDTRSEDQNKIAEQIMSGMTKSQILNSNNQIITNNQLLKSKIYKINDRKEALEKALGMAKKGDIVLLAGKGHEKTILHGTTEIPWNDFDEAVKIMNEIATLRSR